MLAPSPLRLASLDIVRGVAVLGILLLNIVSFGLPEAAYLNPRAYGGASGTDLAAYLVNFLLFDGRMRGLFALLFGASMLLVADRAAARGEKPATVHFARMAWLLLFGLAHLWLVWRGDILSHYALVGALAFAFRGLPVARLVALGATLVLFQLLLLAWMPILAWSVEQAPWDPAHADARAQLTAAFGVPAPAAIGGELALYRGGYPALLAHRFFDTVADPLLLLVFGGAETLAYMLFGMAALRSGLFSGAWPARRMRRWVAIGFGIGLPGYALCAVLLVESRFGLFGTALYALWLPTLLRPPMVLGWACLILLLVRADGVLGRRLAATGRMAFTNYLATSLICTTLFYGYGLGWYGHLGRAELYLVVVAVWALILAWSKPWLDRFRYGPFEWLWRSLMRGAPQAIRGAAPR